MTTAVTYHRDGYGPAHPAINVKLHARGRDFWPRAFDGLPVAADGCQEVGQTTAGDLVDAAYNITQAEFWDEAQAIATAHGLGEVTQEGRSGGWLVIDADPTHGGEDDPSPEWLAGYRVLTEWAAGYLAAAPDRVAALAWRLALDEKGRTAVGGLDR